MAYDIGVGLVLVFITWRGAKKGFVWQLAMIAALVLAFCFAGPLSGRIAPLTGLKSPLDRWVSLLGLYIVFSFGCFLVARALKSGIEKIKFEDYDSHLGALFGFLKGAIICCLVTFFAVTLWPQSHPYILGSHSGYAAAIVFDELRMVVPEEYHPHLDASLKKLGQCGLDPVAAADPHDDHAGHDHGPGDSHDDDSHADGDADGHDHADEDHHHMLFGLLAGLPKERAEELHEAIDAVVDGANPAARAEILRQLKEASPETIADLVRGWQRPAVGQGGEPLPLDETEKQQRRELLFGVARLYTKFPAAQQSIVDEVAEQLQGVPPRVQLGVLRDWHADLLEDAIDPDAETSPVSPLDQRIQRQLTLANVPIDTLDQALRDRLVSWR